MATHQALAAVSRALIEAIRENCPRAELQLTSPGFEIYQPAQFDAPMKEGFSITLYRVAVNTAQRNLGLRLGADGRRYRPSLPLDLAYLVAAWSDDSERQLRMLGWVIRFLEDTPVWSGPVLNSLQKPRQEVFRPNESVELICDPLALVDFLTLWDKLKPKFPASITYVARMVAVDSDHPVEIGATVQTRILRSVETGQ